MTLKSSKYLGLLILPVPSSCKPIVAGTEYGNPSKEGSISVIKHGLLVPVDMMGVAVADYLSNCVTEIETSLSGGFSPNNHNTEMYLTAET